MPKRVKMVWVTFRMDPDQQEALSKWAYAQGITNSQAMRDAVTDYIAKLQNAGITEVAPCVDGS